MKKTTNETYRKLVLTYGTRSLAGRPNIEMKFADRSRATKEGDYLNYLEEVCDRLNKTIKLLIDNADFHIEIVEVKTIK